MIQIVTLTGRYDGFELTEIVAGDPRRLIGLVRGLDESWAIRTEDIVVPGAHGQTRGSRERDRLVIELFGYLYGVGSTAAAQQADLRANIEEVLAAFDNIRADAALEIDLEDGGTATIQAAPSNIAWGWEGSDDPHPVVRRCSIELDSVSAAGWERVLGGS